MNPTVPDSVIAEAYERDPASAAAEYGAEFRSDVAGFLDRALVEAAVDADVAVRPPREGISYFCFADVASGAHDVLHNFMRVERRFALEKRIQQN